VLRGLAQAPEITVLTYGLSELANWQARNVRATEGGGSRFELWHDGQQVGSASIALPGLHNVSNALAVFAVADRLGLPWPDVQSAVASFSGTLRRFELKGEALGIAVVDDYAHHPSQVRAVLAAARLRFPQRPLWAFFQPHTFSRLRALLDEFACSFADADHVWVTDIYASREKDSLGISALDLVQRLRAQHPDVHYCATLDECSAHLAESLQPGDVLLTLGAGDGYRVGESVLAALAKHDSACKIESPAAPNATADEGGFRGR